MSSDADESNPAIARPEPDTLERKVFEARLEARMLGGDPELPRVDRFVLERMLGAGGMGTVWLARDETLARHVALKLVRGHAKAAGERMRLREARGLARLAHPNVIAVYDVGEHEGRVWLAMEYVPGRTLRECAAELERAQVLALWLAAGRGLAAIHAANLVHRDVKPDNVLLGDDGRVRVIDLGLVRAASSASLPRELGPAAPLDLVLTPGFVGTRSYAAPEQLRGEPVDARADQHAFCVALLESLRAAKPPAGCEHEPLAPALLDVLARGRAPLPEQRFVDMNALLAALASASTGTSRSLRGRKLAPALAGLALLGSVALGFAWSRGTSGPSPAWQACMARAADVCTAPRVGVVELVVACSDSACTQLDVSPPAAVLLGERLPFDIDVDLRSPGALELRWHAAGDAGRSGSARLEPGRHTLAPHWQRDDVPICVEIVDARGEVYVAAIGRARDCE